MLIDWIHWLSSIPTSTLLCLLTPLLLLDGTRYALGAVWLLVSDFVQQILLLFRPRHEPVGFTHRPSVCAVVAGLNESDTIAETLESLWNTYPGLQIIVVDDGSTDGMADVARRFADDHGGITVLRRESRGGKSSALNFALPFTRAEIVVCVDSDSHLAPNAIWEIVQPFADPRTGAVSGTVLARNAFRNVVTWLQACEYLRTIFLGRMVAVRFDILGIISGAFGAYRRDAISKLKGWDVGPGEDGDLTLRLRKSGYRIAFAPYAQCFTNLPTRWKRLALQRRRWEWSVVTFECRKHVDMGNPWAANFRWSNLALLVDRWIFNLIGPMVCAAYVGWLLLARPVHVGFLALTYYSLYLGFELLALSISVYFSLDRRRDLAVALIAPCMPLYQLFMKFITLWAVLEELLTRRSFRDSFVPRHVRDVTWHW